jgi:hypothetical protein
MASSRTSSRSVIRIPQLSGQLPPSLRLRPRQATPRSLFHFVLQLQSGIAMNVSCASRSRRAASARSRVVTRTRATASNRSRACRLCTLHSCPASLFLARHHTLHMTLSICVGCCAKVYIHRQFRAWQAFHSFQSFVRQMHLPLAITVKHPPVFHCRDNSTNNTIIILHLPVTSFFKFCVTLSTVFT